MNSHVQTKRRRFIHKLVPSHYQDPLGLARRVVLEGGREGRFAVLLAVLGLAALPFDLLMAPFERRRMQRAGLAERPILLVCGPPRSGTTVVAQTLIEAMPVGYFTNVTSLFPRSPVTASSLLKVPPADTIGEPKNHYGRTSGFRAPNDALYLWDRWLGSDRNTIVATIASKRGQAMAQFFGEFQAWTGRPTLAKNNALNAHAALVAAHLPTARFICLDRDPVFLAQSLLEARSYIHGDPTVPYGLAGSDQADPIDSVIAQVQYHRALAAEQANSLGPDRFSVISYEAFCADPRGVAEMISATAGIPVDTDRIPDRLAASRSPRLPAAEFDRLESALGGER